MGRIRNLLMKTLFKMQNHFRAFILSSVLSSVDLENSQEPTEMSGSLPKKCIKRWKLQS